MRRPFLTAYEYGQGAVWCVILADSRDDVAAKYPDLTVFDEPPEFMSEELLRMIRERMTFDIDDAESEYLAGIRGELDRPR